MKSTRYIKNGKPTEEGFYLLTDILNELNDTFTDPNHWYVDETDEDEYNRSGLIHWLIELYYLEAIKTNPLIVTEDKLFPFPPRKT